MITIKMKDIAILLAGYFNTNHSQCNQPSESKLLANKVVTFSPLPSFPKNGDINQMLML